MVKSSSSQSSTSEDDKSPCKSKDDKESSGSDFETQPVATKGVISPKGAMISRALPSPKPHKNVNTNILTAIAKGTSNEFISKMNAAMIRNLHPKSPMPAKKLNRIGFDNDESSSDNKKNLTKDIKYTSKHSSSSSGSSSDEIGSDGFKSTPVKNARPTSTKKKSSSDSDSDVDAKKKAALKQVSFSKSTVVDVNKNLPKKSLKNQSDSSEDDSKAKQIELLKRELKKLQTSRKRRESSSDSTSNVSSEDDRSAKKSEVSSPHVKVKIMPSRSNCDRVSSSDDDKMTSILTQRETPSKKCDSDGSSESRRSSDSDTSKKCNFSSNKPRHVSESDPELDSALKQDKLFSQLLTENSDYKEFKIASIFDPGNLTKADEIYTCTLPKHIDAELLLNQQFSLNDSSTVKIDENKYNIKCQKFVERNNKLLCLINRNRNVALANVHVTGQIKLLKISNTVQINEQTNLINEVLSDHKVDVPETKQRHPLFGSDLSKLILNENVQSRLDSMIMELSNKIKKTRRKKSKLNNNNDNQDDGAQQIIKEDVYKMLNFLYESNDSEVKKPAKEKKRKKSVSLKEELQPELATAKQTPKQQKDDISAVEPPAKISKMTEEQPVVAKKSKKSKLKLNSHSEVVDPRTEHLESMNISNQIPKLKTTKSKKSKHDVLLANSTFASPSLNAGINLFRTNESIISNLDVAQVKPANTHLEKVIYEVSKVQGAEDCSLVKIYEKVDENEDVQNTEGHEPVVKKKKKKKSKDKTLTANV